MSNLKEISEKIKKKDLKKALELCEEYINKSNEHIIQNFKGVIYLIQGNLDLSEKSLLQSLKIKPNFEDPIKNLYIIYLKKKLFKKLLIYAKQLVQIDKLNNEYNYQLAYAYELNHNFNDALNFYNKYIDFDGKNKKQALNNIGCLYLLKNKPKIANNFFLKGVIFGEDKIIINNLLRSYILLRDLKNSEFYMKKAESIDKNFIEFKYNKAKYLILTNQIQEAIEILEHNKNISKFLITLLILYSNINKKKECDDLIDQFKNRITTDQEFFNYYGLKLLFEGNFNDGWKYYEYRKSTILAFFKNLKEWTGDKIENKDIVVFYEQGLGDSIQFSKYLIPLTKKAKNVTFVVQDSIKNLFKNNPKNLSIETIENCRHKQFDFKISLGSLIKYFYTEKIDKHENLIQTDKTIDLKWKNKINSNKLNVGLVWSGGFNGANEPYRSVPLESLKRLFTLNAEFYCLQNEIWDRDKNYFKSLKIVDCSNYKLDEVASIIKNLDLVITSDTSFLHLSASLRKETWAMLSLHPDWRWGELYNISPYSSLKIFKQDKFHNWKNVEDQIFKELEKKIAETY